MFALLPEYPIPVRPANFRRWALTHYARQNRPVDTRARHFIRRLVRLVTVDPYTLPAAIGAVEDACHHIPIRRFPHPRLPGCATTYTDDTVSVELPDGSLHWPTLTPAAAIPNAANGRLLVHGIWCTLVWKQAAAVPPSFKALAVNAWASILQETTP